MGEIAGTQDGMFIERYELKPQVVLSLEELTAIIHSMGIVLGADQFAKWPDALKRHFTVYNRYGQEERYSTIIHRNRTEAKKEERAKRLNSR